MHSPFLISDVVAIFMVSCFWFLVDGTYINLQPKLLLICFVISFHYSSVRIFYKLNDFITFRSCLHFWGLPVAKEWGCLFGVSKMRALED